VASLFDQTASFQHDNQVRVADRAQTVCDDEGVRPSSSRSMFRFTIDSDSVSSALVASSNNSTGGLR